MAASKWSDDTFLDTLKAQGDELADLTVADNVRFWARAGRARTARPSNQSWLNHRIPVAQSVSWMLTPTPHVDAKKPRGPRVNTMSSPNFHPRSAARLIA